jgi:isopropylmalate/homocitrate/citramalate synthase
MARLDDSAWAGATRRGAVEGPVELYDSTLRDGEQTPGVCFSPDPKLAIARLLDRLRVPTVEAGFPAVSPKEAEGVRAVARAGLRARVVALARLRREDIDAAAECGVSGVLLFIATSDLHLRRKLRMSREEALAAVSEGVSYARGRGLWVQFTPEDASRTEPGFLCDALRAAEEAGAQRVGLADTVGVLDPASTAALVRSARAAVRLPVAVHLHDDLGLATANTLAALEAGARAAAVTVNGLGERAGNASLEEVAVALEVLYGLDTGLDLSVLSELSSLVARLSGVPVPPTKAVVGANAFAHGSGIHVAAVLEEPSTYEPYPPELVGARRRLVFGKHSGRRAVEHLLRGASLPCDGAAVAGVLAALKGSEMPLSVEEVLRLARGARGPAGGHEP